MPAREGLDLLPSLKAALGIALALAAQPAFALPEFVAPVEGDWFDGASWSSGSVPTSVDAPSIGNGATARASSSSPFYPGGGALVEADSLDIGASPPSGPANVSGRLETQDVDLSVVRGLAVGNLGADSGSASGALVVTAGPNAGGDLRVGEASIGRATAVSAQGDRTATGSVTVSGDLLGIEAPPSLPPTGLPDLFVGYSSLRTGETNTVAAGRLTVGGSASDFETVQIGVASGPGTVAEGSVVIEGDLARTGVGLGVGTAVGGGSASGSLHVGGDATGFGTGSLIRIGLSGEFDSGIGTIVAPPPTASGDLYVGGDLIAPWFPILPSALSVGQAVTGTATGAAIVEGTLDVFGVQVGSAFEGDGNGWLRAGEISARELYVGLVTGGVDTVPGSAVGEAHVAGDVTSASNLGIVSVGDASLAGSDATGTLHVGGSIRSNPSQSVSVFVGTGRGSSDGVLEVEGISGLRGLIVGSSFEGEATGSVLVRSGGLQGQGQGPGGSGFPPRWSIGTAGGDGSATGVADVTGAVDRFSEIAVGRLESGGTGSADGTLILRQGTATGRAMQVGVDLGSGMATGRLHLDQSLVVLDNSILLGDGSHLEIDVASLVRGTGYGAIDASLATLGGVLEVDFTETPEAGIYDLIVSGSEDGISGDFDSVVVTGVDPALVSFGIEIAPLQGRTVEAYRLRLVPEPGTALLLGLGLGALALVRRHPEGRRAARTARRHSLAEGAGAVDRVRRVDPITMDRMPGLARCARVGDRGTR